MTNLRHLSSTLRQTVILVVMAVVLSACTTLPSVGDRPYSAAQPAEADSALVQLVERSSGDPQKTGFRLLPLDFYALDARIALVRSAAKTLDVQYYLIQNDRTGRLLMRSLRDAARRGVRVRLLVDDLYTVGGDAMFRGLSAFPGVEVRLFNPFCCARHSVASKFVASLGDIRRLNHRMHNKLFIADGVVAVMGGRNIADEYFARNPTDNFVDMDVLLVGSVIPKLADIFDAYWNSPQAYPAETILGDAVPLEEMQREFDHLVDDGDQMRSIPLEPVDLLGYGPFSDDLHAGRLRLLWGTAVAFADQPGKVMATSAEMSRSMSVQMNVMDRVVTARRNVVISSPYFIPGATGVEAFADLARRNVSVSILTNSWAANDVPLVHAGYARYRVALLRTGMDLYELSPRSAPRREGLEATVMSLGRLHAKAAVVDERTVYLGSMNLDPRSESANTELGILAECPELAAEVIQVIRTSQQRSSYRLRFAGDGTTLEWLDPGAAPPVVLVSEPEVTPQMRLRNLLFAPFVPEQLL
jgi:cardiolipin synthase C